MQILNQTSALLIKNLKINIRNKIDVAREFIFPLIIIAIIIIKRNTAFFPEILLPFYFPLTIIGLLRKILIDLVLEKSQKYKETFKIMSLKQISFTLSWLLTFYVIGILIEIIMLIVLYYGRVINETKDLLKLVISYVLYLFSSIHLSFCLTSIFSNPKKSIKFGSMILTLTCFFYFLATYVEMPVGVVYLISVIPQANLALSLMSLQPEHTYKQEFNIDIALGIQTINIVFYFILYLYLEEVIQNEYGVSKNLCFFFNCLFSRKQSKKQISENLDQENNIQNTDKIALKITNLSKNFNEIKAVSNLCLDIPEGELFCLLGHNGAGKSTTINLLTGMLNASEGNISIFGLDFQKNLDFIRRKMGFCPQNDVLYDYLTLQEHLDLIIKIKGVKIENKNEIEELLEKLEINKLRNKFARNLSLGNKRKLSLALAIIGDSQIIFLDEPTSGMDPNSRRVVWELLRNLKERKKSIILTTHHLEEAEELADRVGILSAGKMLVLGTVDYVKKEFGMGYVLTIASKGSENIHILENIKEKMIETIKKQIKEAKLIESQSTNEFFKVLLPFHSQKELIYLFEELEKFENIQFSLDMNTLEDAFINIGLQNQSKNNQEEFWREIDKTENKEIEIEHKQFEKCSYLWIRQVLSIFLRRFLLLINDLSSSFTIYIMHLIYLVIVVIISKYAIDNYNDIEDEEKIQYCARIILSSYILLSTIFLGHHVTERETHIKYLLVVMGCKISAYWVANFCFDFLIFLSSYIILTITIFSTNIDYFVNNYGEFSFIILAFGFSIILFAYFWSFLFRSYHSATHLFPLIVFCTYAIPYLIIYLFKDGIFPNEKESAINSQNGWEGIFLMFMPLYLCERGISLLINKSNNINYIIDYSNLAAGTLFLQGVVWIIFIYLLENKYIFRFSKMKDLKTKEKILNNKTERNKYENLHISENLTEQENLIKNDLIDYESLKTEKTRLCNFEDNDILKIFDLKKQFKDKSLVLKGLNFCVSEDQIFALLGPNGAGKTTTFNIMTSMIEKDSGLVLLDNKISSLMQFYNLFQKTTVGICPQFNGLYDNLKIKHHFLIYGILKGLSLAEINHEYDSLTRSLNLTPFLNIKSMNLSGGNKRKLCVCLAILGNPKIIFMDEPSTGIDPISKRLLWNLLKKRFHHNKSSVVLTTHSMSEAEFLGTKIGILIDGNFYTINSLQALKSKYSDGYRINFKKSKINTDNDHEIEKIMKEKFSDCSEIIEKNENFKIFKVGLKDFSFSKSIKILIEEMMENNKLIEDFSISYCSLEQIFLKLVNGKIK